MSAHARCKTCWNYMPWCSCPRPADAEPAPIAPPPDDQTWYFVRRGHMTPTDAVIEALGGSSDVEHLVLCQYCGIVTSERCSAAHPLFDPLRVILRVDVDPEDVS